jgi:hypothetical protein
MGGVTYTKDLKVFPDRVVSDWWRKEGHLLDCDDMEDVFSFKPEVIVVGTGMLGAMKISKRVKEKAMEMGITLLSEKTGKAVEIFNEISKSRKTAGLFHLTC